MAVPVWQPALTKGQSKQIERVQRTAFYIILGKEYENYDNDLILLERETLEARRIKLCKKFARKALKNPRYANWFYPANKESSNIKIRGHKKRSTFNLNPFRYGGDLLGPPCRKIAISPEPNLRWSSDQSVNSSLSVVVQ